MQSIIIILLEISRKNAQNIKNRVLVACPKTGAPRPDYTTLITDHFSNNNHTDLILPHLEITSESFWGYSLFYRWHSGSKKSPISSEHCCVKSRNLAVLYNCKLATCTYTYTIRKVAHFIVLPLWAGRQLNT